MIARTLEDRIAEDMNRKMVLLSGPRQVGKTTLARTLLSRFDGFYLNYDNPSDRDAIRRKAFQGKNFVCLDEFHKHARWKAWCKGAWDSRPDGFRLLLTGSARLDIFQKAGDSLVGRYFLHHLFPLTLGELAGRAPAFPSHPLEPETPVDGLEALLRFGGFPEPFLSASEETHTRWLNLRRTVILQEEIRSLSEIRLLSLMEDLLLLLPDRIGSLFSFRSLAEELHVSVPTVESWLGLFDRLFITFRLRPWHQSIGRAIRRQPKFYLWDWSQIPLPGARFENLVALHLAKAVQTWNNLGLMLHPSLHFLHDSSGREVDFLVAQNGRPWLLVEAKLAEEGVSAPLHYFCRRLGVPAIQVVATPGICRRDGAVTVLSADRWLARLG